MYYTAMAMTVELHGGPLDGAVVVMPDDLDQYVIASAVTNLASIRPQDKAIPQLQVGTYAPPNPLPETPPEHPRWYWVGYTKQESNE